ncbi:DUF1801 domain-containing protein [Leptobacterium flavescens]|uniref:DUF1801 domain-containing protein n=1 Tax=Leptobacterium flavescens TaxID=472055 RepID=A0A6P0UPS9_9FLAO|nr:DUF1801 domain-containing protein [Leptobacterium flavescens]NER15344.1 DUF1801 domain-containing protein [Leptobacterium flavescens]
MAKTKPTDQNVTDFINAIPHETRRKDGFFILDMMKRITGLEPVIWGPSIIGFGSYHYKYDSGHEGDAPLIAFSPRKQHQVLYVLSNFKGQEELLKKLGKYKTGKVCLYVTRLENIDLEVLEEIVQKAWDHNTK